MRGGRRIALGAALPVVAVAGYGVASAAGSNPFYPTLGKIGERFAALWLFDRIPTDVLPSLQNLLAGFLVAVAVGVVVGLLLGRVRILGQALMPLLTFGRSIPPLMLIPPLVLVLGIGDASKIAIIALGAVFPVLVATIDGMRQAEPVLLDVARAIGLGRTATVLRVWLPAAAPSMFGGIQTGLQIALVLMVSSEMIAAYRGLGYVTMQAQLTFDAPTVWAGIALLALLGFALNALLSLVHHRVLAWHEGMRAGSTSH
jgi:sulfonate transport system permease protein